MVQKIRVFKLAREFALEDEAMVAKIQDMGIEVRNYMSALDAETAQRVRRLIQRERTENTVEEHIRPTVVRRRMCEGTPARPMRKRPPKVEEAGVEPAEKAVRRVAKPKVKPAAQPQLEVQGELASTPVPQPALVEEAPPLVSSILAKSETVPEPRVEAELLPEPRGPVPLPEIEEVPIAARPEAATTGESPEIGEQPAALAAALTRSEVLPLAPPSPPATGPKPAGKERGRARKRAKGAPPVAEAAVPIVEKIEIIPEKRFKGVEVAEGPAVLRPSSEAPVVKRRIVPMTPRPQTHLPARSSAPVVRDVPQIREVSFSSDMPAMPLDEHQSSRRGRQPQRRREVESREMSPQGRFTGVGPGKYGATPPGRKRRMAPGKKGKKTEITTPKASKRVIRIEAQINLQELAKRMGVKATELLMHLMGMGVGTININSTLDADTAKIVASDFGYEVENVALGEDELLAPTRSDETEEEKKERTLRPPVVTMMGHVDHGKTSLLDKIRKSDIASQEAGGITQHLGAYRAKTARGMIAFIDTPGHEAFTAMRSRGANVTDIVVLVIAADDGVMPQTIEAINHARAAGVPIIVAINKCDMHTADLNRTRRMLMEQNLVPEDLGGDTIMVEVSAKTGEGVDKLLEMLALQAEVLELTANSKRPARGVVLEAYLDRGRGPVANVLVQEGTLEVGQIMVAGSAYGKIRAMADEHGRKIKEAEPSTPVEVLGLAFVPGAGDQFDVVADMKVAEKVAKSRVDKTRASSPGAAKPSLEALYEQMQVSDQVELKVIVKTDVQGTMEALRDALEKQSTEKVKVTVVHASVGGITESDVLLASTANAIIIGFNVRPAGKARQVAEEQGVEIRLFSIIYEVVDSVKQAMVGLLAPEIKEEVLGQVEVRDTFNIPKVGTVAGSYVVDGKVVRNARARLIRDSVLIWQGRLGSLRRFKDDVKEVTNGFECGISLDGYNDVKIGDVIEVYTEKEIEATL